MGDTNMDMTRSKIFNVGVYACAAIGAVTGAVGYGGGTLGGILGMGAVGAVAGGLGIPLALTGVAVMGYVGYVGLKSTIKALKSEGAAVPLGLAIVGISAAKALFVEPVKSLHALLTRARDNNGHQSPPARSMDDAGSSSAAPSRLKAGKLKAAFAGILKPLRKKSPAEKPAAAPQQKPPAP